MIFLLAFMPLLAQEPQLVLSTGGHTDSIRAIAFTKDGRYLVSAGDDKTVRVWNVATGLTERVIRGQIGPGPQGKIFAIALSPDNRFLAVGGTTRPDEGSQPIRIHDFQDLQKAEIVSLLDGASSSVTSLAFSPSGQYLASGEYNKTVRLWDMTRKREVRKWSHDGMVSSLAFSPDGKRLASGSIDKTVRLWDITNGKVVGQPIQHQAPVSGVAFSPDGRWLASVSDDRAVIFSDANTGRAVGNAVRMGGTDPANIVFSPDSTRLVVSGQVDSRSVVDLLSVPTGQIVGRFLKHDYVVRAVAFSPDGATVASAGGQRHDIYLWDAATGAVRKQMVGKGQPVWNVGFARDGRSIAFGNRRYDQPQANAYGPLEKRIWLKRFDDQYSIEVGGGVSSAADFLTATDQLGNETIKTAPGRSGEVSAVLQVFRGGSLLRSFERTARTGYRHTSYTFTPSGAVISGAIGGMLTMYDPARSSGAAVEFQGHTGIIGAVAVSPKDPAMRGDANTLVSGSSDQTIRIWDLPTGKTLLTIFVGEDREWVAWTPEGYYACSPSGDQYVGWHVNQGEGKAAEFHPVVRFKQEFWRPEVVAEVLRSRDLRTALDTVNRNQQRALAAPKPSSYIRSILPPDIIIIDPKTPETVAAQGTFNFKAAVSSPAAPLTQLSVLRDGGIWQSPPLKAETEKVLDFEVPLHKGLNTLQVIAAHKDAKAESPVLKINWPGGPEVGKPSLFVLAVGISSYKSSPKTLAYAHEDAQAIAQFFEGQRNGPLFGEVKVSKVLVNADATSVSIKRALRDLVTDMSQASNNAYAVVFLSGHGQTDREGKYFFCTYEHALDDDQGDGDLSGDFVFQRLNEIKSFKKPGSELNRTVILFIDTCHAGAGSLSVTKNFARPNMDKILNDYKDFHGIAVYASSTGSEFSEERADLKHGVFTFALLDSLRGKAASRDGFILSGDLESHLKGQVKDLTSDRQHPYFWQEGKATGEEFRVAAVIASASRPGHASTQSPGRGRAPNRPARAGGLKRSPL